MLFASVGADDDNVRGVEGVGTQAAELACCAKDGDVRGRH